MVDAGEQPIDVACRLVFEKTGVSATGDAGWAPVKPLPPFIQNGTVYLTYVTLLPQDIQLADNCKWVTSANIAMGGTIENLLLPNIMNSVL